MHSSVVYNCFVVVFRHLPHFNKNDVDVKNSSMLSLV